VEKEMLQEMKMFIKLLEKHETVVSDYVNDFSNQTVEAYNNLDAKNNFTYNMLQGLIIALENKGILEKGDVRSGMNEWTAICDKHK